MPMKAPRVYTEGFFDFNTAVSRASAEVIVPLVFNLVQPRSVLDVGCARGLWLSVWKEAGVDVVVGVDGPYIDPESLLIPKECFHPLDVSRPISLEHSFDLVQSLEVAEHIPADSADTFVDSLCRHGDVVLFSAAPPGQGGRHHINEQPLDYWRHKFATHGYRPYDAVRGQVVGNTKVLPWYRYNTLLYANDAGARRLDADVLRYALDPESNIPEVAPLAWRMRRTAVRHLPRWTVEALSSIRKVMQRQ